MRSFLALAVWLGLLAAPLTVEAAPGSARVRVGAVPAWVKPLPMPASFQSLHRQAPASGSGSLLYDDQERFAEGEHQAFMHLAYVVNKPSDVQQGSELSVRHAPDFERLTFHFARLYRAGAVIDALRTAEIRTLDTEVDRERFMYDEGQNVVIVLKDVRPGDAIEWAYTLSGQNPAIANHVLSVPRLAPPTAVESQLVRLLTPKRVKVNYRLHGGATAPSVGAIPDYTEYQWLQSNVLAVEDEGDNPSWYVSGPWTEFSDFSSWAEVVEWARPLYAASGTPDAEFATLTERWRNLGSQEASLAAAVRFVQEEVRYLGMEIGPHSLVPHPPAQTYAQRFGDCKDKTLLLVALLQRLGIGAVPALVSSHQGKLLPRRLPSPLVFDHVITKVTLGGQTYWFDPTVSNERGGLSAHAFSEFHFALPLAQGTVALEALPPPPSDTLLSEIEENYELGDLEGPIELVVRTALRGARADEFRARLEQQSLRELTREYANFFAKRFDGVEQLEPPVVLDNEAKNLVTIQERYRIASLFRDDEIRLTPWSFEEVIAPPEFVQRKTPLGLAHPFAGEHRVVLHYTRRPDFELPTLEANDGAIRFAARSVDAANGGKTQITFTLHSLNDAVEVERLSEHLALRRRIDHALELTLRRPRPPVAEARTDTGLRGSHFGAAFLGGLGVVLLQVVARRRRRARHQSRTSAATTPASEAALSSSEATESEPS